MEDAKAVYLQFNPRPAINFWLGNRLGNNRLQAKNWPFPNVKCSSPQRHVASTYRLSAQMSSDRAAFA